MTLTTPSCCAKGTQNPFPICRFITFKYAIIIRYRLDRNAARHLVHNYGDRAHVVAAIADSGYNKLLHPKYQFIEAEVVYAVDYECAVTAVDALARRTRLAFLDRDAAFEALPKVISLMSSKLGWDAKRQEKEYDTAVSFLDTMHAWAYYKVFHF